MRPAAGMTLNDIIEAYSSQVHSDEFERDAVRISTTSGLRRRQVASDLGVGLSTLNKWVKMVSDEAGPAKPALNSCTK